MSNNLPRALPFITIEESSGRFVLDPRAEAFLDRIASPIAVVCVAGKYRTGKSTFLNRVLLDLPDGQTGFSVGGTVQACTKGLWMHTELMGVSKPDGSTLNVLVIDTEGLGAFSATATHDSRIFALALLVASYFIYNSVGTIDEQAISNLSLVANISKHVKARSNRQTEPMQVDEKNSSVSLSDAQELGQLFPHFLWLIRDFSLQLRDENGNPLSENDYLEHALADKPIADSNADEQTENRDKNRLRALLRAFFPHRSCATLVRPCANESDLQSVDRMAANQLRPEFRSGAKKLRAHILRSVPQKLVDGRPLSGRGLLRLCQSYIAALNSGAAPVIRDSWALLAEVQFRDALESAQTTFCQCVDQASNDPLACSVLDSILEQAADSAFEVFARESPETNGPVYEQFQKRLHEKLVTLAKDARRNNLQQLNELAHNLVTLTAEPGTEEQLMQLSAAEQQFLKRVQFSFNSKKEFDPTKSIWTLASYSLLLSAVQKLLEQQKSGQEQITVLQEQLNSSACSSTEKLAYEEKIFDLEKQLIGLEEKHASTLAQIKDQHASTIEQLERAIHDLQTRQTAHEQSQLDSAEQTERQQQIKLLQEQVELNQIQLEQSSARANALRADFEAQIAALKQETMTTISEMQSVHKQSNRKLLADAEKMQEEIANLGDQLGQAKEQASDWQHRCQQQKSKTDELADQLNKERANSRKQLDQVYETARLDLAAQHAAQLELLRGKAAAEAQVERLTERNAILREKLEQEKPNVEAERALALLSRSDQDLKETRNALLETRRTLEDEKQKCRNIERQLRDQALDHEMAKMRLQMQYEIESARQTGGSSIADSASFPIQSGEKRLQSNTIVASSPAEKRPRLF